MYLKPRIRYLFSRPLTYFILLFAVIILGSIFLFFFQKDTIPHKQVIPNSASKNERMGFAIYTNPNYSITFQYPKKWGRVIIDPDVAEGTISSADYEIGFSGNKKVGIDIDGFPWWVINETVFTPALEQEAQIKSQAINTQEPQLIQAHNPGDNCEELLKNRFKLGDARNTCVITNLVPQKAIERYLYAHTIAELPVHLFKVYTFFNGNRRYDVSMEVATNETPDSYKEFLNYSEKIQNRTAPLSILTQVDEFDEFVRSIRFIK